MDEHETGFTPHDPVDVSSAATPDGDLDLRYAHRARDADLVAKVQAGDAKAFGVLYDEWFDRVFDLAYRIVRDREVAAEVAQDTFLSAWKNITRLRDPNAFGGWLLRIARNGAFNRSERERRASSVDDQQLAIMETVGAGASNAPDGFRMEDSLGRGVDPERAMEDSEMQDLVWESARALGPRDAEVLDLQLRHGLSPAEVGEVLGMNRNAANQLVHRVRGRLDGAVRARVLWRGGQPRCEVLERVLHGAGITEFDADAVKVINKHADACELCQENRALGLEPAAMFAALPLMVVPVLLKTQTAAALQAAGVSLVGSIFGGSAVGAAGGAAAGGASAAVGGGGAAVGGGGGAGAGGYVGQVHALDAAGNAGMPGAIGSGAGGSGAGGPGAGGPGTEAVGHVGQVHAAPPAGAGPGGPGGPGGPAPAGPGGPGPGNLVYPPPPGSGPAAPIDLTSSSAPKGASGGGIPKAVLAIAGGGGLAAVLVLLLLVKSCAPTDPSGLVAGPASSLPPSTTTLGPAEPKLIPPPGPSDDPDDPGTPGTGGDIELPEFSFDPATTTTTPAGGPSVPSTTLVPGGPTTTPAPGIPTTTNGGSPPTTNQFTTTSVIPGPTFTAPPTTAKPPVTTVPLIKGTFKVSPNTKPARFGWSMDPGATGSAAPPMLSWTVTGGSGVLTAKVSGPYNNQADIDLFSSPSGLQPACPGAVSGISCRTLLPATYTYTLEIFQNGVSVGTKTATLTIA